MRLHLPSVHRALSKAHSTVVLQADKSLRLLAFLQNTLRSAADRINKSNFRGRVWDGQLSHPFKFIIIKAFRGDK